MSELHVIVPEGIDDPARPSGGNAYDRRLCDGLAALGWAVREHAVPGAWPWPGTAGHRALERAIGELPDGAVVLLDGLIASAAPEELVPHAGRLRQVVLVHMPLAGAPAAKRLSKGRPARSPRRSSPPPAASRERERSVLAAAAAVVTTSEWTRRRLVELYGLPAERIGVAEPGVDRAGLAPGTPGGGSLLCVATVTPGKGHDVLLDGLATASDLVWDCTCAGSLDRDPAWAAAVRARAAGIGDRVRFPGAIPGAELDRAYAAADLLVLASHAETYGMVVTEALARGVPVLAGDVGGVPEALGHGDDGTRPGLLVPPGDPAALGAALRSWLTDAALRERLRRAARERRATLRPWSATAADAARILAAVADGHERGATGGDGADGRARRATGANAPARVREGVL